MHDNILKISEADIKNSNQNALLKTLNKNGNGYCIYLSNSVIQLLELQPETDEIKYTVKDNILYIVKAQNNIT